MGKHNRGDPYSIKKWIAIYFVALAVLVGLLIFV
jgi:hypothetical protein